MASELKAIFSPSYLVSTVLPSYAGVIIKIPISNQRIASKRGRKARFLCPIRP
jgi:hypothetical protein